MDNTSNSTVQYIFPYMCLSFLIMSVLPIILHFVIPSTKVIFIICIALQTIVTCKMNCVWVWGVLNTICIILNSSVLNFTEVHYINFVFSYWRGIFYDVWKVGLCLYSIFFIGLAWEYYKKRKAKNSDNIDIAEKS